MKRTIMLTKSESGSNLQSLELKLTFNNECYEKEFVYRSTTDDLAMVDEQNHRDRFLTLKRSSRVKTADKATFTASVTDRATQTYENDFRPDVGHGVSQFSSESDVEQLINFSPEDATTHYSKSIPLDISRITINNCYEAVCSIDEQCKQIDSKGSGQIAGAETDRHKQVVNAIARELLQTTADRGNKNPQSEENNVNAIELQVVGLGDKPDAALNRSGTKKEPNDKIESSKNSDNDKNYANVKKAAKTTHTDKETSTCSDCFFSTLDCFDCVLI